MSEFTIFLSKLFDTADFPPRWHCGQWSDFHGWLYIGSNLAIWSAYFAIPIMLLYFIFKKQYDLPFQKVVNWFIAFILFCGVTHLIDAVIFWEPLYRLNAVFLFGTGVVSWVTVIGLIRVIPKAIEFKSPKELQRIIEQQTAELQAINDKLQESESRFKALVNNNPDLVAQFDQELKHTFVNQSIIERTEQPKEFFIQKSANELGYPEEQVDVFEQNIDKVFKIGLPITFEQKGGEHESWEASYFLISLVPVKNIENEVVSVISISRDISSLKRTELQLRSNYEEVERLSKGLSEKNHQLENFAYIVSHNLRSPLGNLNTLFELYSVEEDEEEKKFLFQKLEEVVQKLNNTVTELTQVVEIRQNTAIERQELFFKEVLSNIEKSLYTQIEEGNIEITHNFDECPSVYYPYIYLESILQNLLTNGIKYKATSRPSKISFVTNRVDDQVILTYEDNGLGIDLKRFGKKIFGLNKTFHAYKDSRGVGLFMTKNQIEALGGSINVESEVNAWTRFTIIFDLEASNFKE